MTEDIVKKYKVCEAHTYHPNANGKIIEIVTKGYCRVCRTAYNKKLAEKIGLTKTEKYKEKKRVYNKKYRENNREKIKIKQKEYQKFYTESGRNKDRQKKYRLTEKYRKYFKEYINTEKYKICKSKNNKKNIEILSDSYIKGLLRDQYEVSNEYITNDMIEQRRIIIKIHRIQKEAKNATTTTI